MRSFCAVLGKLLALRADDESGLVGSTLLRLGVMVDVMERGEDDSGLLRGGGFVRIAAWNSRLYSKHSIILKMCYYLAQ